MDVESLYETFKTAFHYFIGKPFDENVNSGESRKLARTLCAYFINKKAFLKSPLINSKISVMKKNYPDEWLLIVDFELDN